MTPADAGHEAPLARDPVEELAEAFLERYRRGERPSLSEFIARAPAHAQEIRELFPALVLMERADPAARTVSPPAACKLERLGDYRLIREVGRGGMGIVYEAEQEALGRHVALKILPLSTATDGKGLMRFRREARSAARLHHTNIVPVFDIGEREGVHYYAMQFIRGRGLDEVIAELRRMRPTSLVKSPPQEAAPSGAASLADGLLSGTFPAEEPASAGKSPRDDLSASGTAGTGPDVGGPRDRSQSVRADSSGLSGTFDVHFYRSVARVGLQVAEALAYAHSHRVLHRDIKPSNLLLDTAGAVWVTDFGLAKEQGDDVTRTGDVVGTLRYLAPERLSGTSEIRSDLYGLGVTLYELLTLQPAFPETDRARLVQRITRQEPVAPRKIDPRVPRDLETVVLKAIAKEPSRRYATATDMAEDLRRFLMDRPIRARRTSQLERAWRWCRRNPGWSATIAMAVGLLLLIAIGGGVLSLHLQKALSDAQIADEQKTEKLWLAHVQRARALRSSGRVGQRFEALKAIREAAKIRVTPELRDETVAALVLPDVEQEQEWEGFPEDSYAFTYDAAFDRYARMSPQGEVMVCRRTPSGEEVIARLPLHEAGPSGRPVFQGLWMSPSGRHLAYGYTFRNDVVVADHIRVWKLDGPKPTYWDEPTGVHEYALAYDAEGRRLALGDRQGVIRVYDLETRQLLYRRILGRTPNSLAFDRQGGRLAVAASDAICLLDIAADQELGLLRLTGIDSWSFGLAWHPEGRLLAATSMDQKIHIWDTQSAVEAMPPLEGRTAGMAMFFNESGDRLLSSGWDGQTRLWDIQAGRLLLTIPGYAGRFSRDGSRIGISRSDTKLRLLRLADGRELRTIRRGGSEPAQWILGPVLHEDGTVLAGGTDQGMAFFDLHSGKELAFVKNDAIRLPRTFDQSGGWMTCGSPGGAWLWPARRDPFRDDLLHVGPPKRLASAAESGADASADGRIRAIPQGNDGTLVLDRDRPGRPLKLGPQHDVRFCAVSPDGVWVAGCSWGWDGRSKRVRVWKIDNGGGQHVVDLPLEGPSQARFSPDGRWLATWTGQRTYLWEVDSWHPGRHYQNGFFWSADGRLLAVHDELSVIRLVEPDSGKEVFRLTGPEACWYSAACLTPDGTRLIAIATDHDGLLVWDLRLIRKQLRELGMDWDWPEYGPGPNAKTAKRIVAVEFDPGEFRRPVFASDRADVAAFSMLLALQPINPEAYFRRGLAYGRLNKLDEAIADYEMFLNLAPQDDRRRPAVRHDYALRCNNDAWTVVGVKRSSQSALLDAALRHARKAVELKPENSLYQNTLGVALYRVGEHEEAAALLEKNVPRSLQFAAFDLYFLAMSRHSLGQPDQARECFDRANASAAAETGLSPGHRRELAAIRIEAEAVLGVSKK